MKAKLRLILIIVLLLTVLIGFSVLAGRFGHSHTAGGGCCELPGQARSAAIV